ncbi:hypothetical protein [Nocardiopsis kunsanensis]|uniref:Secreted protein n=1 Tax=Nocardiopsis kunsanensis TaxID=141693 RepID=A0A918XHR3_9ACTN|nr:hypothetical protein [Nocardiopsis kunsanensis]GHD32625.1 hypothetical protein GCM10007147_36420 [Nocardiopsis kunsanensis]
MRGTKNIATVVFSVAALAFVSAAPAAAEEEAQALPGAAGAASASESDPWGQSVPGPEDASESDPWGQSVPESDPWG